jgi:CheY-like chemotaxis protein
MTSHRKTILVLYPGAPDAAGVRRLLGELGHVAVTAGATLAALKALGTVRFDIILTSIGAARCGNSLSFVQELRAAAPGSAVIGIREAGGEAANEAWLAECDATIRAPLSPSRMQWVLDFELRYFGS